LLGAERGKKNTVFFLGVFFFGGGGGGYFRNSTVFKDTVLS